MASQKQISANRLNAKRSTGPKSIAGKRRASRNSYRHGLSLPIEIDLSIEIFAKADALLFGGDISAYAKMAAHEVVRAQLDLLRIRSVSNELMAQMELGSLDVGQLRRLAAIDRYERRALARRRRFAKVWD